MCSQLTKTPSQYSAPKSPSPKNFYEYTELSQSLKLRLLKARPRNLHYPFNPKRASGSKNCRQTVVNSGKETLKVSEPNPYLADIAIFIATKTPIFYKSICMLNEKLQWRYATKKMDPAKLVSEEKVEKILEAIRLAPTSSGLQPFEVIVVKDVKTREKIQEIAWNQSQITEGSHLLVFAAWDNYTEDRINYMFDLVNEERGFKNEGWEAYRQQLLSTYPKRDAETNFNHAARQAYIGLGLAMTAAAFEEVDSTPMEGFDPVALDNILDLPKRGLRSVAILPIGYRDADNDWLVNLKKVRRPREQFVSEV